MSGWAAPSWSAIRFTAPTRACGSYRASTAILVARSRNSSGYFRGATMLQILPGLRCLHQSRGETVLFSPSTTRRHVHNVPGQYT
jgi:hypothetical protein